MADPRLLSSVDQVLGQQGLSFSELRRQTRAIALFGSRAAGCERPGSDWDLLCIGHGRSRRRACLDLVWIEEPAVEQLTFLGGDLAGHVAAHGTWIHGEPTHRPEDVRFDVAAQRKEERLVKKLRSFEPAWHLLDPGYQEHDARLLRRDAQRLELLHAGVAVPPSAHLDALWDRKGDGPTWFREVLRLLGTPPWLADAMTVCATSLHAHRSCLGPRAQPP